MQIILSYSTSGSGICSSHGEKSIFGHGYQSWLFVFTFHFFLILIHEGAFHQTLLLVCVQYFRVNQAAFEWIVEWIVDWILYLPSANEWKNEFCYKSM